MGAPQRWAARALAVTGREGSAPQRRHRRLPVCEDDGGGWGAKGLRRRQEGARPKAIPAGGHGGLVLEAKVHSAKVPDQDGIELLPERARDRFPRLPQPWVDAAGYRGRGKEWAERALGLSVEVVHRSPKPTPEKVLFAWAREWHKEGRSVDLTPLLPRRGFEVLPPRWVVERTFAWICHNRRMSKDYERLCSIGEAFVYAAMTRLMVRRLACA